MDVSKRFCDGERKIFIWNKRGVWGVLCKNILLADLLGSQHLLKILQTSLTIKNSERVVKIRCFEKRLWRRVPIYFRNKGWIWSVLCKNIDVMLNSKSVAIYMKYSTYHPLWKLVKMWWKLDVSKRFCDGKHKFLFEIKEGCKVPCVKVFCWLIY